MLDHVCLDDPVTGRTVPEHCAVALSRVSVRGVGGSDALVAARLAAGDDHALAEVFDRLASAVYGAALRVLGNGAAAQDVVQDVFVELWRHPDRYDPAAGTLRTFLMVQARHRAVDVVRIPVLRGLDVQGLVGHLIGVEDDVHRCLAGDPEVAAASHVESTQPAAARQAGRPAARTRADWRRAADRTLDLVHAAGDPCGEVAVHGMRLPLGALLVARAFELWTHDNDIRRAAGLPASVPDPPTLAVMTRLVARLLPHAAARTGLHEPLTVHLVLTGPGGGTWDIALGAGPPDPVSIRIVADATGFCRLVANRVAPADLDLHVTGDPGRAAGVLAAASALALD